MGFLTESCPPGPCGYCGCSDTVDVSITKEWVQPNHGEGYYLPSTVQANCTHCDRENYYFLVEVWGGKPGYAVGIWGPKFKEAMQAAGWKNKAIFEGVINM